MLKKGEAAANNLFANYKLRAKARGVKWELSKKDFLYLTSQVCFYCGSEPSNERRVKTNGSYKYNGIDRLNSSKGYHLKNCVSCCADCNTMKWEKTPEEFKNKIKILYEKYVNG